MLRRCGPLLALAAALAGCGPPVVDTAALSSADPEAAARVRIFTLDGGTPEGVADTLGPVEAYSCRRNAYGAPPSRADALRQLRVGAARMGADAVTEVTFDEGGTDLRTNCFDSVHASGTAVRMRGGTGG